MPHHLGPCLVDAYVPIEAPLQVARLHEIVHPGFEVLVEDTGFVRPVVEEVANVYFTRPAISADKGGGPRLLIELLVPDLLYAIRL